MRVGASSRLTAGVALAVASVVAVTPIGPRLSEVHIASPAIRLIDSDSILNIPVNLFEDILNIPYNEVQALDGVADSLFFTGNWAVQGAANIWGADPGGPEIGQAVINLLVPFPVLSEPLDQDLAAFDEAELPVSAACAALDCAPLIPLEPITGITRIDEVLWPVLILLGYSFPLLDNWFHVPLVGPDSLTTGYSFGDVVDPGGISYSGFGIDGTISNVLSDGTTEYLMPWSDTTVTMNLAAPFEDFFSSLTATPTGVDAFSFPDLYNALMADLAGLVVAFDVLVPGSELCPGTCDLPSYLTLPALVQDILALDPGNTIIQEWLDGLAPGAANPDNVATPDQIAFAEANLHPGIVDFSQSTIAQIDSWLAAINPALPGIATDSGILGGFDPSALVTDIGQLLGSIF